jgi:hypothetical protein
MLYLNVTGIIEGEHGYKRFARTKLLVIRAILQVLQTMRILVLPLSLPGQVKMKSRIDNPKLT